MHLSPPRRMRAGLPSRIATLVAFAALLLAACGAGSAASPSTGPTPTGAIAPAVTATPAVPTASPAAAAFPLTLTDDEGTAVSLPARPQRIVSLTPATTEILFAVGAGNRVVGVTDADDYPEAAKKVARVVSMGKVDVEKIVGLKADLVVAGGGGFSSADTITTIRALGIPVLVVYATDVAGVLSDIQNVAAAAGEPAAGRALVGSMGADVEAIKAAIASAGGTRSRVFYETGYSDGTIYGIADPSVYADAIRIAGGVPVTSGSASKWDIPLESLIKADPQVIVLGDAAYGVKADQVATRPGWEGMTAVKTNQIRPVNDVVVTRPGPRLVDGLRALALAIDPAVSLPPAPSPSPGG